MILYIIFKHVTEQTFQITVFKGIIKEGSIIFNDLYEKIHKFILIDFLFYYVIIGQLA